MKQPKPLLKKQVFLSERGSSAPAVDNLPTYSSPPRVNTTLTSNSNSNSSPAASVLGLKLGARVNNPEFVSSLNVVNEAKVKMLEEILKVAGIYYKQPSPGLFSGVSYNKDILSVEEIGEAIKNRL